MDPAALVARIRDHYVDQFRRFAAEQRKSCTRGAAEVQFEIPGQTELFGRLYRIDFVKNDAAFEAVEFAPASVTVFDPFTGSMGHTALSIDALHWDDVVLRHDLDHVPPEALARWFWLWFDPQDERHDPAAELSNTVHSMVVEAKLVSVDFGTAEPEAFWELLGLLQSAGAAHITISSSPPEVPTSVH